MTRPSRWILGSLAALFVLSWPFLMAKGRVPVNGNVLREVYPNWVLTQNAIRAGEVPLWNPYKNMGEPHLADPKTLAAYPIRWILAFVAPSFLSFFRLWVTFHTGLVLLFTYWLCRRYGLSEPAAGAGAILAGFNGFFMAHAVYPNLFAAVAYGPAILYYLARRSWKRMGMMLALQWLAGYPPFSLIMGLIVIFAGVALRQGKAVDILKAGAAAALLAAYHILPFAELLRQSSRPVVLNAESVLVFSIPWRDLLKELFVPQWIWFSPKLSGDPAVMLYYAGLPALLLSMWAVIRCGARARWLAAGTLIAFLLCLGRAFPGYAQLSWLHVFRFPASWLFPASLGLAALAALGVAQLSSRKAQWGAAFLVAIDLLVFAQSPTVAWFEPSYLTQVPAHAQAILSQKVPGRLLTTDRVQDYWVGDQLKSREDYVAFREDLPPSQATAYGVHEASSYQVMPLKTTAAYLHRLKQEGPASPLLRWAGVSHVMTFLKPAPPHTAPTLALLTMKDYAPPVFVAEAGIQNQIVMEKSRSGLWKVGVTLEKPATLVIREADYPGWQARLDSAPVPHEQFQDEFLALTVPAGTHAVEFIYQPRSFLIGLALSGGTFLGLLGMWVRRRSGKRLRNWH